MRASKKRRKSSKYAEKKSAPHEHGTCSRKAGEAVARSGVHLTCENAREGQRRSDKAREGQERPEISGALVTCG